MRSQDLRTQFAPFRQRNTCSDQWPPEAPRHRKLSLRYLNFGNSEDISLWLRLKQTCNCSEGHCLEDRHTHTEAFHLRRIVFLSPLLSLSLSLSPSLCARLRECPDAVREPLDLRFAGRLGYIDRQQRFCCGSGALFLLLT